MKTTIALCGIAMGTLGIAACKHAATGGATPIASGGDPAAAQAPTEREPSVPACMRPIDDTSSTTPTRLRADATTFYLCAGSTEPDDARPQCFAVDRARGTYAAWKAPAAAATPAPPVAKLQFPDGGVEVFDASGTSRGVIRPKGFTSESPQAATNASGTYVAVTVAGARSAVEVYEVATQRRTAHVPLVGAEPGCGEGTLLDDVLLVVDDNCGGPDGDGTLYTVRGKKLALLGGQGEDRLNAYDPQPVHLDGTRWAIGLPMSDVVLFVDVKTGKELRRVALGKLNGPFTENGPTTLVVEKGSAGKLLVATGAASVGIIDIATGALEVAWTAPACPEPTP